MTCTAKTDLWRTELAVGGAVDLPEVLWHLGVVNRRGMQSGAYVDWSFALLRPLPVQRRQLDTGRRYTDVNHDPPAALVLAGSAFSEQVQIRFCESRGVRFPPATHRLLGFAGPRHEVEQIQSRIQTFLRDELKLELSESKTLITHATSQAARFLGYEIKTQHCDTKITRRRCAINGAIGLFVPRDVIRHKCAN